jgi:predicted DNA-binding transcriptional regulator AlpA
MNQPAEAQQASPQPAMPMEILTPEQLAQRLQVKRSWVYEQTRYRADVRNADPLPFLKLGLYLRFDWQDVLTWLERQKRQKPEPKRR